MALRLAINGFGRIGRNVMRAVIEQNRTDVEVVAINISGSLETNAHLLRYDSVHGRLNSPVLVDGDTMNVGFGPMRITSSRNIEDLDWTAIGADIVLECTGAFNSRDAAIKHTAVGAKKVLISAPAKAADMTVVYGVNETELTKDHIVVSNASCTTNCLAPVAAVLHQNIGIEQGFMTTIHSYTGDQRILDNNHKDPYRGRAAALSMVPTTTGAAKAVGLVLPELNGRLDGVAMRVPTPNVSAVDFKFMASRDTSVDEINAAFKTASAGKLNGVLGVTDEPLVSVDLNHDPHSAVVPLDQTKVMGQRFCRVLAWYDNEWGFSVRMLDTAAVMGKSL
jgi:glyceraldehyde 3-phosphate dehydrogenase